MGEKGETVLIGEEKRGFHLFEEGSAAGPGVGKGDRRKCLLYYEGGKLGGGFRQERKKRNGMQERWRGKMVSIGREGRRGGGGGALLG